MLSYIFKSYTIFLAMTCTVIFINEPYNEYEELNISTEWGIDYTIDLDHNIIF